SFTDAEFADRVEAAFADDRGGVIHSGLGADYTFGASQSKTLTVRPAGGTSWAIGYSAYGISGNGAFASTIDGNYQFTSLDFAGIGGGAPGEAVVALGVTALSISGRDYGNVTVTARLASGRSEERRV